MVDDPIQFGGAVSTLLRDLTNGIPFNYPAIKPDPFPMLSVRFVFPVKRTLANIAIQPLSAITVKTVLLDGRFKTIWTTFLPVSFLIIKTFQCLNPKYQSGKGLNKSHSTHL